ncbi:MAG: NADH-quinone oxidoreductase subunit NuoF [Chloroflexi bacterium]|nr:NADH-quinone oxidoreductase subunit NuoF [Chloroflexota bacterium]
MMRLKSARELEQLRIKTQSTRKSGKAIISICSGTGCHAYKCKKVSAAIEEQITLHGLNNSVEVKMTGCHGFCERGPLVVIYPKEIFYQRVKPEDAADIVTRTIAKGEIIDELLYADPVSGQKTQYEKDIPFYKKQQRLIFGNNGIINPKNIDDYIALGGYSALAKVLFNMKPEEVINEVRKSGLRGRGGAGFPAAEKWDVTRKAPSNDGIRYVICNADEGDPGAYMDRSLLEGNPHSVLEGMIIGAFAISSHDGYVYVRHEYPLAIENLDIALQQAREYGLLGNNILGSDFNFDIKVSRGGGAFICGEATALMASLEGKIGEPRPKRIPPAIRGLNNKPSNLNNVETWANIPLIINNGAAWYASIGTEHSKGTKIFSLVGKINNTGLVEVPMGITLKEIVFEIGGGIPNGKKFKAIQVGGPSGGCIPENLLHMPVDYEKLTEIGSMMGSGGMIVMDEDNCMVDVARYFIKFLTEESCGKCVPCREGLDRMLDILVGITEGRGSEEDITLLVELGSVIQEASFCGLGSTAANPVLTTTRYFMDEYKAHVIDKRCPAGVCKALITFSIDEKKCTGCMICARECPEKAITGKKKEPHKIDSTKCIKCGLCRDSCKIKAITVN